MASAKSAALDWRSSSLSRRAAVLFRFRELLVANSDELAAIITAEHGKVLSDAAGEIARGLENVEFACGIAQLLKGGYSEQASTGVDVYSIRQPLGVVAGITPFNFPAMVPLWMCANAIACGNAFILKPSEKDPSAVAAAGPAVEAGRPARWRVHRAAGRQGRRRRAARASRCRRGQLRRLDADRALDLSARDGRGQARPSPGREQAESVLLALFGEHSIRVSSVQLSIGQTLRLMGRVKEAESVIAAGMATFVRVHPGDDPDVAGALDLKARSLGGAGPMGRGLGDAPPLPRHVRKDRRTQHAGARAADDASRGGFAGRRLERRSERRVSPERWRSPRTRWSGKPDDSGSRGCAWQRGLTEPRRWPRWRRSRRSRLRIRGQPKV